MTSATANPPNVERAVQIALAVSAALGTLLLGLGQQSVFLPCLAILAAVGSVVLTDTMGVFRLNRNLANLGALLAVIYTVIVMILGSVLDRQESQTSLIRVANLLVYLQVILQFQHKILRIYWSLSVLSLLQVVVASALNLSVSFGPLLAIYMCAALTALSLLFVYRETLPFKEEGPQTNAHAPGPPRRWPLAGRGVRWSSAGGAELVRPFLGIPMARHIVGMGLVSLVVTTFIFFGIPRYDRNRWQGSGRHGTSVTGFSDEVSLGEMGRILQSDEEVLRARFLGAGDGRPFHVSGDVYLRGATLVDYNRGRWKQSGQPGWEGEALPTDRSLSGRVVQDISLDTPLRPGVAGRYSVLFSTYPAYQYEQLGFRLEVDRGRRQLLVDNTSLPNVVPRLRYLVRSGAFRGTRMAPITPEPRFVDTREISTMQLHELTALPQLRATAQTIVDEAKATTPLAKALAIEEHFLVPNRYDYELDPDVTRTPGVDPVEDFVAKHRTGHCEYFASALVLMLRSQNVPARMVVGYKSGEWNSVGSHYQVRQRHAHAWAEAYLAPGEFDPSQLPDGEANTQNVGAWLRLDPTPADLDAEAELGEDSALARMYDMVDYVQIIWDDYVLGLNSERQSQSIYQPIADGISRFMRFIRGGAYSSVKFVLLIAAGCVAFVACGYIAYFIRRRQGFSGFGSGITGTLGNSVNWVADWLRGTPSQHALTGQAHIEFYRRLERLLDDMAIVRSPGQTQREYAEAAGGILADAPRLQSVAGVPRRVAGAFYQVRFGRKPLDSSQRQAVEQSLEDLEAAIHAHLSHAN